MKFRVSLIAIIMVLSTMMCISQNELLQSGPMVGYSEMLEVPVWVQTKKAASVTMKYWNAENSDNIYMSNIFKTKKDDAFTALLIADSVTPGNKYFYDLL